MKQILMAIRQSNHDKPIIFQILLHYQLRKMKNIFLNSIEYTSVYYECAITDTECHVTSENIRTTKMQHKNERNICKLRLELIQKWTFY